MFERLVFTLDPDYFPKAKMREIVANLHSKNQRYGRPFTFDKSKLTFHLQL